MKEGRHNYEYDVNTNSDSAAANVVRFVGNGKRVLELGCGPGSITKILAAQGQCMVTGMEFDSAAIEKATPFCQTILQADLNAEDWPRLLDEMDRFDVVVAADVLEHLYNPWRTLEQMAHLINESGYLVISLPHIGHAAVMACLMSGDFEYRDWGLLDRTHIRFFGLKNIEQLVTKAGLKILDVRYITVPPKKTEFAAQWANSSKQVRQTLRSSPYASLYQVVIKAAPASRSDAGISLTPEQVMLATPSALKRRMDRLTRKFRGLIRKRPSATIKS
ncbi:MAG: class I SAM-dependent methyltransferase [Pseudomonadales bacterium]|jgi:2-polyprenyl-3-methyl-5-hydroxy-6-metoxy-1,4-benzoquinol methylase|nr:class I SAM-dependent methyltransferase [Pseudomonadales bacterium]